MSYNRKEIGEILESKDFEKLIGEFENEYLECKSQPYKLDSNKGKRELAKDVSSMANSEGGFILIGVKTKSSTSHPGDKISEICPFNREHVNKDRYYKVIESWVYPHIADLLLSWVTIEEGDEKGILIVEVPMQAKEIRPFLITNTLDEDKKIEIMFGYVERKRDNIKPTTASDLQRALKDGLNFQTQINERFDSIEAMLKHKEPTVIEHKMEQITSNSNIIIQQEIIKEQINKRIENALEHEALIDERTLTLVAHTEPSSALRSVFQTQEGSIRKRLENPPIVRMNGWSLETFDHARIVKGEFIRVTNGRRKVIDLYRDGTFVFVGAANESFLAWGRGPNQKVHPLATTECIYNFVNFYSLVLEDFESPQKNVSIRVDYRNLHLQSNKTYLVPYEIQHDWYSLDHERKDAPDNDWEKTLSFPTKNFDPAAVAFKMVSEIYLWFGFEEERVPYVKLDDGIRKVDIERIKTMH